ncbi:MAG: multiheme c-type cytochrome [Bryobacteraceae bacterium]
MLILAFLAASQLCINCHPKQVEGYARTGMGRSLGRPVPQPDGQFQHRFSGTRFGARFADGRLLHRLERNGRRAEYPIDYFIGSGNEGRSYLIRIGDALFQSPVSWYSRRGIWDVSPGYERDPAPDFTRPVTAECLFCHAGRAAPVPGTLNRYADPPFLAEAITCERCHGPSERHLARPSRETIVNPVRLPPRVRDSVCEQCHLSGESRIANPGLKIADFEPGRELEEVFSVYRFDSPPGQPLKVVSHSEQFARSVCERESGERMWCGSCHDPHNKPADAQVFYRERCLNCHGADVMAKHPEPKEDCIGCHMPRRSVSDGGHTAFTDHEILRRPRKQVEESRSQRLAAWRPPPEKFAKRNLGLAYMGVGERDQSAAMLNEGFRLLLEVQPQFPNDTDVLTTLGLVLMRKNQPAMAARYVERARSLEPDHAGHYVNLAAALDAKGEAAQAIAALDRAIELDSSLEHPYLMLAEIYQREGETAKRRETLDRYLRFMPQHMRAREARKR